MGIIMENPETGQTLTLEKDASGRYPPMVLPWRVKGTTAAVQSQTIVQQRIAAVQSSIAVYAAKAGLPVAEFLETARWLLDKSCPFCQVATEVLRRIAELGADQGIDFVRRIKLAKDCNDRETLLIIQEEVKRALDGQG